MYNICLCTLLVYMSSPCSARAWVTSCRLLSTWLQYEFIREGSCKRICHFSSTSPILAENGDQPFLPGAITYFNVGHHLCVAAWEQRTVCTLRFRDVKVSLRSRHPVAVARHLLRWLSGLDVLGRSSGRHTGRTRLPLVEVGGL